MSEFAPKWGKPKMTKAQVKAYIANMKQAQQIAQEKLEKAKESGAFELEELELAIIEEQLKNI